ncbi:BON domain-containing protein [Nitrosovibrio sp. Nv6]|uniref:BON domain-containing protein n=1 Tax=Nitrosovibrio sp. Nv6 TaxID=1855340 RepID=UPI0008D88C5C|nr:BON domain-containing protein [Nitrosovibrio sp. Nv6]SEO39930.1 hyperosmotically inducible protein [Nitrosovibrio sp. Nv6]
MNIQNKLVVLTITLIGALSMAGCGKTEDKGPKPEAAPAPKTEPAPEPKTTVGTDIDDNVITTKVKSALLADEEVKGLDIQVETHKGEVQLSGYADNQAQIDRAVTVTRGVEGVKNVENKIGLKTTDTTVGEKIDDGIITTKVKAALLGDSGVDGTDVTVVTRDGEVQLSGYVTDAAQIDRAAEVARGVKGVKNVVNELSVKK